MRKLLPGLFAAAALFAQDPTPTNEPSQVLSTGAGVQGLGPSQIFGYVSMSQRIASQTYTTQIYEATRLAGGKVGTSARAGVSKILWVIGPLWIGLVGDVGVAEGQTGSASGAFSGRAFANFHFGKFPVGAIITAQTMHVAGNPDQNAAKVTIGVSYWFK